MIARTRRLLPRDLALSLFFLMALCVARAASPSLTFYVPFPESDALTAFDAINTAAVSPITTYVSIAAVADSTVIWYDHWEDGYEKSHHLNTPVQPTTEIWGDGNPANGFPPGISNDIIRAGTVIMLGNNVDPANPLTVDYDARDKIVSSRAIAVTRTYWAGVSSTLMAGSVETYDTSKWGTEYRVPVGQDIPDGTAANSGDHQMFEYTALSIMAAENGTTVYIDADNNGTYETTNALNEGQTCFVNGGVNVGGRVTATKPVQVLMFTGDVGSNYETRDSTLLPVNLWSSSYFTPVSSPSGNGTRVWLYNPGVSSITVNYRSRVGSAAAVTTNTATVAAGSYASVLMTNGSGAEFYTTGSPAPVFYAYSTTDSDSATTGDNQAWDWSYTLVPKPLLTPQVLVGLGIGRDPLSSTNPNENGNPIWVTTVGNGQSNATVYVDFNGDNAGPFMDPNGNRYDTNIVARELQPLKIYDPDGDQTAMLVYVLATNVSLAAAWGQDTTTATDSAPGLDAGTAVPPVDVFDVSKVLSFVTDSDGDGQLGPGERVSYEILIGNSSRAPVPADVLVWDALPEDTAYVAGSAAYRTSTNGAWTAIADDASGTAFPLDGNGFRIQASIPVNGGFGVRFQVDVNAFASLTAGRVSIVNTGTVTSVVYNRTLPFKNETYLHGSLGDRVWNDANGNGIQDSGETGINGVIVYLDSNSNGVRDAAERYSVTSGDGFYLLTNALIEAGTHLVRVDRSTLPAPDYLQTFDLDGLSTPDAATVSLAAGQDRSDVDFGYRVPSRLGDFAWVDANANGVQDIGEPGLSNVVAILYDSGGNLVATTNTSESGAYAFTGLAEGSYTVAFVPPVGYVFTASNIGGDASDSDPLAGTNRTAAVTLAAGVTDLSVDAGFYLPASLAGSVLIDVNGNGVADGGDTNGIAGVTVLLLNAASNVVASAATAGNGSYAFSNLPPGYYTVVQVLPGGYTNTLDVVGANDLRIPVMLTSGQNSTNNHFYDTRAGALVTQGKVLYLSDPDRTLDRIDPVASGDTTATNTAVLTTGGGVSSITVAGAAAASTSPQLATSHSFTYNSGTAAVNRILMVGISYRNNDSETVSSVTYGGQTLTSVGTAQIASGTPDGRIYVFRLVNPPTGNNTLQVTWNSALNQGAVVGAVTYAGVDQSTPTGTFASSTGTSTAPSVSVGSASGQLVFGVVGGRTTSDYSVAGGGTSLWSNRPFSGQTAGSGQSKAGAASSTSLTWSGSSAEWVAGGVALIPATSSGTPSVTFTQAPAFGLPFNLEAGAVVTVTGYVSVVSGTMPASPTVSARLSAGGTVFLSVTNATYDSASGALVWSGALPGAVAIAAGEAVALTVSNTQSGVSFQLRYDSSSYPSKIILPTASIIAVPSLAVYDGAYSGGAPVALSLAGTTRYVRLTVTDPFGSADIASVGLLIDGPGASGDVAVTLNDGSVVASNAWSKTYEYVWNTAVAGDYTITATANEGTEGVTAQTSVRHTLYKAALGDRVWIDANGNGAQDAGESGLTNVIVRLLNAASNVVATAVTGATGYYLFTNLPPASYLVEVVAPPQYVFTVRDATVTNDLADSDADRSTGRTALTVLGAAETNLTLDAGLYIPATLFGYVFKDSNASLVRDTGDGTITNTLVRLIVNGVLVASTNTDAQGFYRFVDIPVGAVTVLVSRADATLTGVPSSSDAMRNRALPDASGADAYVPFAVVSGYGVLADLPGEPLNFGFVSYPLSATIDIRVSAGKNGILIDLWTVDETGHGDIVVYAWIGNAWVEVGRVPSEDVVGEGSNKYRIQASGLDMDGTYYLRVVDEAGHMHDSVAPVGVRKIRLNSVRLSLETAELTFSTEHGIKYLVKVSDSLALPDEEWAVEEVSVSRGGGWPAYSNKPFMAGPGGQTVVRIPLNRKKAFFRIVEVDE